MKAGVNFINIFKRNLYALKKTNGLTVFSALSGSAWVKGFY